MTRAKNDTSFIPTTRTHIRPHQVAGQLAQLSCLANDDSGVMGY